MKYNKKATSIIEVMVVLLIVVTWVVWMYQVYENSQKLSNSTNNKIQAIQIAREGIEAMKNIRNTNWIMFWSDYDNCWNTLNYNDTCIWDSSTNTDIPHNVSFTIFQDSSDNSWQLNQTSVPAWGFLDTSWDYRTNFAVYIDSDWFYTQSGSTLQT